MLLTGTTGERRAWTVYPGAVTGAHALIALAAGGESRRWLRVVS